MWCWRRRWGSRGSHFGEKDTSYGSSAHSETEKRNSKDRTVLVFFLFFFPPLPEDRNISPAATQVKNEREAFTISRNSLTAFYTTYKDPFLLHMYSILHSTHPPSDLEGGRLIGMKLKKDAGLKPLECCQKTEDKQRGENLKGELSLWPEGQAHIDHIRGKTPPSFLSEQP